MATVAHAGHGQFLSEFENWEIFLPTVDSQPRFLLGRDCLS